MSRFWSQSVNNLTPYTPGEQPKLNNLLKLNTNENPYGPSPRVLQAISQANSSELRKYPDPECSKLKETLANHFSLEPNQVFVGNSSDEVLAHIFKALLKQRKPILFPDITYSFYPVYCQLFGIEFKTIALREDYRLNFDDFGLDNGGVIFANPNAPTGISVSLDQLELFLVKNIDSVVVVDEAYVDFSGDSAMGLINEYPNLLVVQTLSKSRSLAGLRVGWACGQAELIEGLERVKNSFHPYALDALAQAGAQAAIEDVEYFEQTCAKIIATRESSSQALRALGFEVLPSSANFVLVSHESVAAETIFAALREQNIIVRYFKLPRLENQLRISIGTDEEMDKLLAVLTVIVS